MGQMSEAMLKSGLVTREQIQKVERQKAEEVVEKWKAKFGSDAISLILFQFTFATGGLTAVKEQMSSK